jgi:hypothetical protein
MWLALLVAGDCVNTDAGQMARLCEAAAGASGLESKALEIQDLTSLMPRAMPLACW